MSAIGDRTIRLIRGLGADEVRRASATRAAIALRSAEDLDRCVTLWNGPCGCLLVEDAPFLRYAFGRLLRMQGIDVKEANDGQEALDCLAEFRPHLVLTDLMMPVMGGVELITHIRANPETAGLPVVAITADATEQAERLAREAGAVDVITKPIDLPALLDRLKVLVPDRRSGSPRPRPVPAEPIARREPGRSTIGQK